MEGDAFTKRWVFLPDRLAVSDSDFGQALVRTAQLLCEFTHDERRQYTDVGV